MAKWRQAYFLTPDSRYLDITVIGLTASGLMWWWLGRPGRLAALAWLALVLAGLVSEGQLFFTRSMPELKRGRVEKFNASQVGLQSDNGVVMQVAGLYPAAKTIEQVLKAGGAGGWLPPELTKPFVELREPDGSLGAMVAPVIAGGRDAVLASKSFSVDRGEAILLFAQGLFDGRLRAEDGKLVEFVRLTEVGDGWQRWGARPGRGRYQLAVDRSMINKPVIILWPRPLHLLGYGVRRCLAGWPWMTAVVLGFWIIALAGVMKSKFEEPFPVVQL